MYIYLFDMDHHIQHRQSSLHLVWNHQDTPSHRYHDHAAGSTQRPQHSQHDARTGGLQWPEEAMPQYSYTCKWGLRILIGPLVSWMEQAKSDWSGHFKEDATQSVGYVYRLFYTEIWSYGAYSGFWCKKSTISSIDQDQIQLDYIIITPKLCPKYWSGHRDVGSRFRVVRPTVLSALKASF